MCFRKRDLHPTHRRLKIIYQIKDRVSSKKCQLGKRELGCLVMNRAKESGGGPLLEEELENRMTK